MTLQTIRPSCCTTPQRSRWGPCCCWCYSLVLRLWQPLLAITNEDVNLLKIITVNSTKTEKLQMLSFHLGCCDIRERMGKAKGVF